MGKTPGLVRMVVAVARGGARLLVHLGVRVPHGKKSRRARRTAESAEKGR